MCECPGCKLEQGQNGTKVPKKVKENKIKQRGVSASGRIVGNSP